MYVSVCNALHKINILTSVILIACTAGSTTTVQLCVCVCECVLISSLYCGCCCYFCVFILEYRWYAANLHARISVTLEKTRVWTHNFRRGSWIRCGNAGRRWVTARGEVCRGATSVNIAYSCADFHLIWLTRPSRSASIAGVPQFNLPTMGREHGEKKLFTLSPFQQAVGAERTGTGCDYGWLHKSIQFVINFKLFILY